MANQRIALLGAAEGPWVDISRVPRPVLRVHGLREGVIDGRLKTTDGEVILFGISENQEYCLFDNSFIPAHKFVWIQLCASRPSRSLVCSVINAAA